MFKDYDEFMNAARLLHIDERRDNSEQMGCAGVNYEPPDCDDPYCPGWAVFHVDRAPSEEIQRCDQCKQFKDDDAALEHVLHTLCDPEQQAAAGMTCGDGGCTLRLKRAAYICTCHANIEGCTAAAGDHLLPGHCPSCNGVDEFIVQLPAVFHWNGRDECCGNEDLSSSEHPLDDEAVVVCCSCDWTGTVAELHGKE